MPPRPLLLRRTAALVTAPALLAALSVAGTAGTAAAAGGTVHLASPGRPAAPSPSCPATEYTYQETLKNYAGMANGQDLDMDIYQPKNDPQAQVPGVILVHGGGWAAGNFTTMNDDPMTTIGDCLAENGFDAFSIDYALTANGSGSFPENLQDIQDAITYVKNNVRNLQGSELFILGTSAGGNLADLAGENAMGYHDDLAGVITQSGPADLSAGGMGCASATNCQAGSDGAIIAHYLGCYDNASATCTLYYHDGSTKQVPAQEAYTDASPTTAAPSATIPYLVATSSDEQIPLAQAVYLTQRLISASGCTSPSDELVVLPGDQHALSYSDILAGPMLSFLQAAAGKRSSSTCTVSAPLTGAAMAYDANPSARTVLRFGGCCTPEATMPAGTEAFDTATGTWKPVKITGASPVPRVGAAFGYYPDSGNPAGSGLVLFGGEYLPGGPAQPVALNDTWELSYDAAANTGTWTQVDGSGCLATCPGAPPGRYGASADEAPGGQGLVLFGGEGITPYDQEGGPPGDNDTWLWNGAWTQVDGSGCLTTCTGAPPGRYGAVLAYDVADDAEVVFGGDEPTGGCRGSCLHLPSDTWTLGYDAGSGAWTWTSDGTGPAGLAGREFAAGASTAGGAMLFGGLAGTTGKNANDEQLLADTWTWNGSAWSPACDGCATVPPPTAGAAIAYDRSAGEDLLYGGYTDTAAPAPPATTWAWTGSGWVTK